ncbi:GNAT family N-acetyltransferase [Candidatus Woesearchaeota archaeon]|jgi:ribosomal protein S18 acetylase RimI-like enzyme|nr:GNAT family N-acetyltransferase [Candidatus Woesearchaeota archaeon]MBT4387189.1 GNAT family N-acetyltransferase [Candidatus Woesearchaeota archaeon]MBT4596054.1 GNAT family N-acetyltransferase [Candidatus Woesearchaeota archaeon]MBT5740762.1 GNAT family N-acetyltransferase [Candidatus Woesearchaeota archaeon]MBT6506076.1 GNAT family N-acetyltransferase [Candidatus Woesearchaeota archaeon]
MEIKKAQKSEIIAILSLYRKELSRLIEFNFPSGQLLNEFVKKQENYETENSFGYFIAIKNNEIVGAILIDKCDIEVYKHHGIVNLKHLAVANNYRSLTIGTQLMEFAENKIKEYMSQKKLTSCKIIYEISEEISNSITFLQKCGYIHEGMISDYHVNDVKTYFMGKSLRN